MYLNIILYESSVQKIRSYFDIMIYVKIDSSEPSKVGTYIDIRIILQAFSYEELGSIRK